MNLICLSGVLRPSVDDPYDVMRRSRLVEPRSRARSISPYRQSNQRDQRSQSVMRNTKERKTSTTSTTGVSRTEWFDTEVNYADEFPRKSPADDWCKENSADSNTPLIPTQTSTSTSASSPSTSSSTSRQSKGKNKWQEPLRANITSQAEDVTLTSTIDSRKSILECNVNPYLLVKKNLTTKDEDDLSDDLSDNALELDDMSSSLFDPSKVKSIERLPNRGAVAAIGGQRIRVFNEPRELISDEDDTVSSIQPVTRIPIPKVSPKRPPRRPKEVKAVLKSILKRGKGTLTPNSDGVRKNVLFNVNNIIFAPEKSNDRRISKSSLLNNNNNNNNNSINNNISKEDDLEKPIVPEEVKERPKFITIPNIKEPKRQEKFQECKIIPEVKTMFQDRKVNNNNSNNKRPEVPVRNKKVGDGKTMTVEGNIDVSGQKNGRTEREQDGGAPKMAEPKIERGEDETNLEIEIEELKDRLTDIETEDKDLLLKADGKCFHFSFYRG